MEALDMHCLVFNRFEERVCKIFQELAENKDFCDVTLACGDRQVQAHRIVLSAVSPIFQSLLKQNPNERPYIYLRGVKYDQLVALLEFIYKGEVNISQVEVEDFLDMANDLQIEGLSLKEEEEEEERPAGTDESPQYHMEKNLTSFKKKGSEHLVETGSELVEANIKLESNDDFEHFDLSEDYNMDEDESLEWTINQSVGTSNTKSASCDKCNRTFKSRQNLKQHIASVHQKVRYDCDQCEHKASTKSNLRCHIATQHEGIKYECDICDYTATNRSRLKKHKDSKHENELAILLKKTEEEFKQNQHYQQ